MFMRWKQLVMLLPAALLACTLTVQGQEQENTEDQQILLLSEQDPAALQPDDPGFSGEEYDLPLFTSGDGSTDIFTDMSEGALLTGLHHAEIEVQDYGTMELELDADAAPITVTNFVNLAKEGFYDGLTFHRIIYGFMMQGGDPAGDGTGGSGEKIIGEFPENGYDNPISHERGVIAMARGRDYNSASSQFYIMHEDTEYLDGQDAPFGRVISGIDVVDRICADAAPVDGNGTIAPGDQPVITRITILD